MLQIVSLQAISKHEAKQERHGARWAAFSPSANRSLVNVKEAGCSALREAKGLQCGAEVVGGHLRAGPHHIGQQRVERSRGHRFNRNNGPSARFIANGGGSGFGFVDVVGGSLTTFSFKGHGPAVHFILQRARAPFRMTETVMDKMSARQEAFA